MERPSKNQDYSSITAIKYSWINDYKETTFDIYLNSTASNFITKDEVERYFKLKLRNFIKDYEIIENRSTDFDFNYFNIEIELYKYNDKMNIYYGLFKFSGYPSINYKEQSMPYIITIALAGSKDQIKDFIKSDIDSVVEVFAEDYYYIEDIKPSDSARS